MSHKLKYIIFGFEPLSAGFVSITEKDGETVYRCFGESFTLNLKSRGETDSSFINTASHRIINEHLHHQ